MNLLAFETSTAIGSLTLIKDELIFDTLISKNQKKHSEFINQACANLLLKANLSLADIDMFAVDIGPGSFTGARVSVNVVRAYAHLLNKPIYAENSLKILASQTQEPCLCLLNAQKNMTYLAAYSGANCLISPTVIQLNQIESFLIEKNLPPSFVLIGDGFGALEKNVPSILKKTGLRNPKFSDYPFSENLAQLALKNKTQTLDWKSIIPLYIRGSEAEENLRKK